MPTVWDTTYNPYTRANQFSAASADPQACNNGQALTAQALYLTWIPVIQPTPASSLYYNVQAAGVTTGTGVNLLAVYSQDGQTQLALSPDQTTNFAATGNHTVTLTAFLISPPGVYVAALANYTGTAVGLMGSVAGGSVSNLGPFSRSYSNVASQTSMPSTVTPATVIAAQRVILYAFS